MARETKVGLVAGLAFIVCFAIILTQNGERTPLPASSRMADASRRELPTRTSSPAADPAARNRPRSARPTTTTGADAGGPTVPFGVSTSSGGAGDRPATPEWRRPMPVTEYDPRPEPASRTGTVTGADPIRSPTTSLASHPPQPGDSASGTNPEANERNDAAHPARGGGPADTPGAAQSSNLSPAAPASRTAPDRMASQAQSPRRAVLANYTVAPGDTLTHIAVKHYGHGSRSFINAIVDANRSTIADPDELRAGVDLVIPSLDSSAGAVSSAVPGTEVAGIDRPVVRHTSSPSRTGQYRWYQIKKNDRYISIAREQLGDASRWEEIYTLNKEKFPDAGMIREGVRIKLPMDQSASAERRP